MSRRKSYQDTGNDEYRAYSEAYDSLRMRSEILKMKSTMHRNLNSESGIRSELNQLQGLPGKDGHWYYGEGNRMVIALLPAVRLELKEVERQFGIYRQNQTNGGYATPPNKPEFYPPELRKKRQQLEAKEDVYLEECQVLTKALETYTNRKAEETDRRVLQFGCQQAGKLRGGTLAELDFQIIKVNSKGLLIIQDDQSPYKGMAVTDYRSVICKLWNEQRAELYKAVLLKAQDEAREAGETPPKEIMFGGKKISKSSLPGWPAHIVNHLNDMPDVTIQEPEKETEIRPFKRTKFPTKNVNLF